MLPRGLAQTPFAIIQESVFAVVLCLFFASEPGTNALIRSGLQALASGDLDAARTALEDARHTAPNNPQVWLALTQLYARARQDAQRSAAAQHAAELAHAKPEWQNQASIRNYLGKVELANADFAHAIADYREAIRLDPSEEAYRFDLAQALLGHERFPEAVEVLEDARTTFHRSAQIELALGVAYYGQRRFPEAVSAFLRTIEIDPDVVQPYVFLGRMVDQAGDRLTEVTRRFIAFQKSNPDNYLGYLILEKALAADVTQVPHPADQEKLLRQSIALKPDYWESHYELGVLLEGTHAFAAAAIELERSAELNPDIAATHYHLARVYDRLNRPDGAAVQRALHQQLTARDKITAGMEPSR